MTRNELVDLVTRADHLKSGLVLQSGLDEDVVAEACDALDVLKAHLRAVYANTTVEA